MADSADLANAIQEKALQNIINSHVSRTTKESAYECEECLKPIPEGRRLAVKGTQHCVDCAEYFERKCV